MDEEWKIIPGFKEKYMVSNTGLVKSIFGIKYPLKKHKILKQVPDERGFMRVRLFKDKQVYNRYITKLMQKSFFKNAVSRKFIYKDGNKKNLNLNNIKCVGRVKYKRVIPKEQVNSIIALYKMGTEVDKISKMFKITEKRILKMVKFC